MSSILKNRYTSVSHADEETIFTQNAPSQILLAFFEYFKDKRIFVLNDEYDHFISEVLDKNLNDFSNLSKCHSFIKNIYKELKNISIIRSDSESIYYWN